MGAWPADRPSGWPTGRGALGRPRTSSRRWPWDSTCRRAARPPKTSNRCPPPTRMADRQQGSTAATCQPQRSAPCDGHWCSGHIGSSAISTAPVHQEDAGSCGALWVASRSRCRSPCVWVPRLDLGSSPRRVEPPRIASDPGLKLDKQRDERQRRAAATSAPRRAGHGSFHLSPPTLAPGGRWGRRRSRHWRH